MGIIGAFVIAAGIALLVGAAVGFFGTRAMDGDSTDGASSGEAQCQENLKTCQDSSARIQASIDTAQGQTSDLIEALLNCQRANPP